MIMPRIGPLSGLHHFVVEASQSERLHGSLLPLGVPSRAADELDEEVRCALASAVLLRGNSSATSFPRIWATSAGSRRFFNASRAACTRLTGLLLPRDLVRMSRMPASSTTGRTEPPAMTPVLGAAGFIIASSAEFWMIGCGIVAPSIGTRTRCFLAISAPLRMASRNFVGLAQTDAHGAVAVADHDQRAEAGAARANHFRHTIDLDDAFFQVQSCGIDPWHSAHSIEWTEC